MNGVNAVVVSALALLTAVFAAVAIVGIGWGVYLTRKISTLPSPDPDTSNEDLLTAVTKLKAAAQRREGIGILLLPVKFLIVLLSGLSLVFAFCPNCLPAELSHNPMLQWYTRGFGALILGMLVYYFFVKDAGKGRKPRKAAESVTADDAVPATGPA